MTWIYKTSVKSKIEAKIMSVGQKMKYLWFKEEF